MMDNMSASRWTVTVGNCSASTERSHIYIFLLFFIPYIWTQLLSKFSTRSHLSALPPHPPPRKEKTNSWPFVPGTAFYSILFSVYDIKMYYWEFLFVPMYYPPSCAMSMLCMKIVSTLQMGVINVMLMIIIIMCFHFVMILLFSVLKLPGYLAVQQCMQRAFRLPGTHVLRVDESLPRCFMSFFRTSCLRTRALGHFYFEHALIHHAKS